MSERCTKCGRFKKEDDGILGMCPKCSLVYKKKADAILKKHREEMKAGKLPLPAKIQVAVGNFSAPTKIGVGNF